MNLIPRFDNVIVMRVEEEQKTDSGLILKTEDRTQTVFEAVVLAAGPDTDLTTGHQVMFDARGSQKIKDTNGDEYLLIKNEQVVAVVAD